MPSKDTAKTQKNNSASKPKKKINWRTGFKGHKDALSSVGKEDASGAPVSDEQLRQAQEHFEAREEVLSEKANANTTEMMAEAQKDVTETYNKAGKRGINVPANTNGNPVVEQAPESHHGHDDKGKSRTDSNGNEVKDDEHSLQLAGAVEEVPLEELKEEIKEMIGMEPFKAWIDDLDEGKDFDELADLLGVLDEEVAAAEADGRKKKSNPTFYHMVLMGNPGTGKSKVAEAYCQYLRSSGIMPNADFYKISAGDIVSEFIGATASHLKELLNRGKDEGKPLILHLDEAYSLTANKHGEEALTELVNAMTEEADRIVLVLSGYEAPMMEMIEKNEGMRSRVRIEINCPDYDDNELLQIMKLKLPGQRITRSLSVDAEKEAMTLFSAMREKMGLQFGNGRVAEVLLQDMQLAQEKRLAQLYKGLSKDEKLKRKDEIKAQMRTYDVQDVKASAAYRNLFGQDQAQAKTTEVPFEKPRLMTATAH